MLIGIFLLYNYGCLLLYVNGTIENIFPSEKKIDHCNCSSILTTHILLYLCCLYYYRPIIVGKGYSFDLLTSILTQHFKLHLSSTECITTSLWLFYPPLIPSFEKMRSRPPTDTILLCILYRPLYSHNLKCVFFQLPFFIFTFFESSTSIFTQQGIFGNIKIGWVLLILL